MDLRKIAPYLVQGLAVGILAGFLLVVIFRPSQVNLRPSVEIKEAAPQNRTASHSPASYSTAVENAAPAVVNIFTSKATTPRAHPLFDNPDFRRFFGDRPKPKKKTKNSLGSGVVISKNGYILTNYHVISEADEILVAFRNGSCTKALVEASDPDTDFAVLRVPAENLPAITIGHSDELLIGDVVLAIGNPFGVGQTVTMGIVSATGRSELGISTFENFIQTDAAINPGNSGGALVNARGELVGINTAIFSRSGGSQGIGFAIPIHLAKNIMKQIVEHGHAIRGWLGIEVQNITKALADSFNVPGESGVLVAGVLQNGPGHIAGLLPGDIITHVNNKEINKANSLINVITNFPPETEIQLTIIREIATATAVVGERPKPR
ncbi:Outer membrane stress sensor protease DegS [hydrothermal vent metagenome]|uniref:Outer membrane stress sensor protease DegS n=1 Tax=hydrothermal vent metagenome TaxID=652676 RepID=A0A3B0ZKP5_9ZZZZ